MNPATHTAVQKVECVIVWQTLADLGTDFIPVDVN
jgi:hypothetical protein